jgi:hypothetical protein
VKRSEANAEIAKRLWPEAEIELRPSSGEVVVWVRDKPGAAQDGFEFDAFVDEVHSRVLVQWFAGQSSEIQRQYLCAMRAVLFKDYAVKEAGHEQYLFWYLLAPPEQVAKAACVAFDIELDEEGAQA